MFQLEVISPIHITEGYHHHHQQLHVLVSLKPSQIGPYNLLLLHIGQLNEFEVQWDTHWNNGLVGYINCIFQPLVGHQDWMARVVSFYHYSGLCLGVFLSRSCQLSNFQLCFAYQLLVFKKIHYERHSFAPVSHPRKLYLQLHLGSKWNSSQVSLKTPIK